MLITDATAMNRYLAARSEQRSISIKCSALVFVCAGSFHFSVYTIPGRLLLSIKESGKFLLLGFGLALLPGEALFYGLFFLLFVHYEIYMCWRLRVISDSAKGDCPAREQSIEIELQREDRPTLWKYCPLCGAALELRDADRYAPCWLRRSWFSRSSLVSSLRLFRAITAVTSF